MKGRPLAVARRIRMPVNAIRLKAHASRRRRCAIDCDDQRAVVRPHVRLAYAR
jgi:hypothetical protein